MNQNVSFTSRNGSAHHTKLQQLEETETVQANCTVRSLQYVITQYSTHVHDPVELGEERTSLNASL